MFACEKVFTFCEIEIVRFEVINDVSKNWLIYLDNM